AFAAVEGEGCDARSLAAGEIGERAVVFVVGVGDDEHEGGAGAEFAQELLKRGGAVVEGQGVSKVGRGDTLAGEVGGIVLGRELGGKRKGRGEQDCLQGCEASGWAKKESHAIGISGRLAHSMVWSG